MTLPRPCTCDKPGCRPCWLANNDGRYQKLYGLPVTAPAGGRRPRPAPSAAPADGPGTRLKVLWASLGVTAKPGCTCNKMARQMDEWGAAECRARRGEIVAELRENAPSFGLAERVKAAVRAVTTGLAFRLDPFDPYGSMVDEAIRQFEANP